MTVITIARQLGAGGGAVATELARRLGWRLLDRALVERIAEELQVGPDEVEACDERVESFAERLGLYLSEGFPELQPVPLLPAVSPELAARAAQRVVGAIADEGPAVIVGHGAQCVLEADPRAFHVLLYAPVAVRVARAQERFGLEAEAAAERIRQSDANRKAYIREHFGCNWLDPVLYHLCADTGRLGLTGAVELVEMAVQRHREREGKA